MKYIVLSDSESFFEESGREAAQPILALLSGGEDVVLDLGAGIGRIAEHVAPHCGQLWLADISTEMLGLAKERLADFDNLHYVRTEPNSIPSISDESIDLVYSVLVLQHLEREDAFGMLRDVRRILRRNGTAYFTFPNILDDGYLASFVEYADTGQVSNIARARFYTAAEVERLVIAAGYTDVRLYAGSDIVAICGAPQM
jgi:ubiquinone/menaquinone biosynthesis C-methylase UbiE